MAKTSLHISIPEPCHEDWNKMTATQCGAFCKSCQKEVIDFTNKSEAQIVEILSTVKSKVCGRFTADKLNTPLSKYEPDPEWYSWKKWAVAAGVLFGTGYVSADVFDLNSKLPDVLQLDDTRTLGVMVINTELPAIVANQIIVSDSAYVVKKVDTTIAVQCSSRPVNQLYADTPRMIMGDIAFTEGDTFNVPPPPLPPVVKPYVKGEIEPIIMGKIAPQKVEKPEKK